MKVKMNDQLERLKQAQTARRKNIAEWRASQIHEETLPSGLKVFLRDVTMTDLLFTGRLPPSLLDMADTAGKAGAMDLDISSLNKSAPEFKPMLDALTIAAMVEPPVAEISDDEHLGVDEINNDDKMFIFEWVNRETEAVRSFRDDGEPIPPGFDRATILDEAESDPALADRLDKLAG